MKIEHFALQVPEPAAMADWYVKHLGFSIARSGGAPAHARFILEKDKSVMLEIYRNPQAEVPDYRAMNPLLLHLAFVSENPREDRDRLVKAGSHLVEDYSKNPAGDELVMLRDPWGIAIQLVKRTERMLPK